MSEKNKGTGLKAVLGFIGGFFLANIAGSAYLALSAGKKMKSKENGNNMLYSVALGKKHLDVKPDTDHAYINCLNGMAEIELSELPINYDLYIELGSILAVFAIKLPEGIRVCIEGTGSHDVVNNMYGEDIDKSLPTVHILIDNTRLSAINVVRAGASKRYTEL